MNQGKFLKFYTFKIGQLDLFIHDFFCSESGGTHQSNSPSSTGTGSPKENGAGAAGDMQSFAEPFDFKADEFVSAMDKLLHGNYYYKIMSVRVIFCLCFQLYSNFIYT